MKELFDKFHERVNAVIDAVSAMQDVSFEVEALPSVEDAQITLSVLAKDGNNPGDGVSVCLFGEDTDVVNRVGLDKLLAEEVANVEISIENEFAFSERDFDGRFTEDWAAGVHRNHRLVIMLARAHAEWTALYAKLSPDELRATPLPAWTRPTAKEGQPNENA